MRKQLRPLTVTVESFKRIQKGYGPVS